MQFEFRHKGLRKYAATGRLSGINSELQSSIQTWLARLGKARSLTEIRTGVERVGKSLGLSNCWTIAISNKWKLLFAYDLDSDQQICREMDLVRPDEVNVRLSTLSASTRKMPREVFSLEDIERAVSTTQDGSVPAEPEQNQQVAVLTWGEGTMPSYEPPLPQIPIAAQSEETLKEDQVCKLLPIPKIFGAIRMFYRGNQKAPPEPMPQETRLFTTIPNLKAVYQGPIIGAWDLELWAQLVEKTHCSFFGKEFDIRLDELALTQSRVGKSNWIARLTEMLDRLKTAKLHLSTENETLIDGSFIEEYVIDSETLMFQIGAHCEPLFRPNRTNLIDVEQVARKIQTDTVYRQYLALLGARDTDPRPIRIHDLHQLCTIGDNVFIPWVQKFWERLGILMNEGLIKQVWLSRGALLVWIDRESTQDEFRKLKGGIFVRPKNGCQWFTAVLPSGEILSPNPITGKLAPQILKSLHLYDSSETAEEDRKNMASKKNDIRNREKQKDHRINSLLEKAAQQPKAPAVEPASEPPLQKSFAEPKHPAQQPQPKQTVARTAETGEEQISLSALKNAAKTPEDLQKFLSAMGIKVELPQAPDPEPDIPGNKTAQMILRLNGISLTEGVEFLRTRPSLWAAAYLAGVVPKENYTFKDLTNIMKGDPLIRTVITDAEDTACLHRAQMIAKILGISDRDVRFTERERHLLDLLATGSGKSKMEQAQALLNAPINTPDIDIARGNPEPNPEHRAWINEYLLEECALADMSELSMRESVDTLRKLLRKNRRTLPFTMRGYVLANVFFESYLDDESQE